MGLTPEGSGAEAVALLNVSETIAGCVSTGVLAVDNSFRVIAFNPEAERLLRVKAAKVVRQPVSMLPRPIPEVVREVIASGKNVGTRRVEGGGPDHDTGTLTFSVAAVESGFGSGRGAIVLLRDQNYVSRLETHLRRLDRLASVGTMTASVAHEVKNALVPIKTFVELLVKEQPTQPLGEMAWRELGRLEGLVNQMLRFAGPTKATQSAIRIHALLDHSVDLLKHHWQGLQVTIVRGFRAETDTVLCDAHQMEQAILNVLLNSLEAMTPGGTLTLETFVDRSTDPLQNESNLVVVVHDTGVGIQPDILPRIFETFFTTKPHGTGLGLAITRRIIQEHHGQIQIESVLQQGTKVTLMLPLKTGAA